MIRHFLLLILLQVIQRTGSVYFTNQCPQYCLCDNTANILTVTCSQINPLFSLPYIAPVLSSTSSVISKYNYLQRFPTNFCDFQNSLRILDISSNSINDYITVNTFNCLIRLEFLNASYNLIKSIEQNAFILSGSLSVIDLSHNALTFLPAQLFSINKLQKLKYLFLNNNQLNEIDVWFFYLNSIIKIDLSYNLINKFSNKIGYTPQIQTSYQLPNATLVDLRFNKLTKFDDSILSSYFICDSSQLAFFFHLMNVVQIDQNPYDCSCSSYNMLMFYQTLKSGSSITTSSNIFKATCLTPSQYFTKSIFEFIDPNSCASSIYSPVVYNCKTTTVSTSTLSLNVQNPNNPELLLGNQAVTTELSDGQIAGVVIGFFGAFILMMVLLYCICPIEILACLFGIFPLFYKICPCKSGVLSNKYYDIFVSYNKSSEQWINDKLVPFLRTKRPNDKYFLQYDPTNAEQEKFGSFTRGKMDNSAILLLVLSDKYLMKEWQVPEFRNHVRHLLTRVPTDKSDRTRLICIQMNDVCDEEVDDYIRHQIQLPRFVSLENDEFYFWNKLYYFLHSNKEKDPVIVPVNITEPIITITSDESPRSEPENYKRDNYLLDEYSTSLEQIIYEKLPSLSVRNETIQDIKYDHNSKKFTYTTKGDPEAEQEAQEEEAPIERIRKKHRKNRKNRTRNESFVNNREEFDSSSVVRSVKFQASKTDTPTYF